MTADGKINPTWSNYMKKIFVGNLAWKVTEDSLRDLFSAIGNVVSVKIVTDQYTGKSRGFGFVEMESSEDAERAIRELNDKPLLDRNLRVSLAQERTERSPSAGGGNREYRGSSSNSSGSFGGQKPYRQSNGGGRQDRSERSYR